MLQTGQIVQSVSGLSYKVARFIGEGGQGQVYEVKQDHDAWALKWYLPHMAADEQRAIIENLIRRGEPSPCFLWPKDLAAQGDTFGYIMPLRPPHYRGIVDMMKRRAEPSFRALCIAGVNLCEGYQRLHSMGYSYRDISFGNVFFDPDTGDVLICDNDNVAVDGVHDSRIYGTPRFMAPEIVTGVKGPSTDTDLYSLSVLLFYMLMLHHPLEGALEAQIRCLDIHAMNRLYGTHPVFIWHPTDKSNRPQKGLQDNAIVYWDLYPTFLHDLFTEAFTVGIHEPRKRTVERVWQDALVRLLNDIAQCPACGAEVFCDAEDRRMSVSPVCWHCQRALPPLPAIEIGRHVVLLDRHTRLLRHHIAGDYDLATSIGAVSQHPSDPRRWGITNLSDDVWTFIRPDGTQSAVEKGRSAPIMAGGRIDFGPTAGTITR